MIKKKMVVIFYFLLLLGDGRVINGYNLETKTIQVGKNVTLTCPRLPTSQSQNMFWVKFSSGNWPESLGQTITFDYEKVFQTRHFTTKQGKGTFVLHIKEAQRNDTALYYCVKVESLKLVFLNGIFLKIEGPESALTAVIQEPLCDPVFPGDRVTLRCSVFSDCESRKCPTDHRVYWLKTGPDKSHPDIIYADGNRTNRCQRKIDNRTKWVYNFSKNISSSDAGIYYCAVATCGEILFGNGTKLGVKEFLVQAIDPFSCFFLSSGIIYFTKLEIILVSFPVTRSRQRLFRTCIVMSFSFAVQNEDGRDLNYAALHFGAGKATRGKKRKETEDSVYSQVKL
uniref:Ig-like domain-containing protein n=1 Tax=Poecilia formosa TaxID=48698 RepID=A0A087XLX7_POEFO